MIAESDATGPAFLLALIAVQIVCAAFFILDVVIDAWEAGPAFLASWHYMTEAAAALSLAVAVAMEFHLLGTLLRRKARLERSLSIASGAFEAVIQSHFAAWNLTRAERDVATFTIKGCSIAEIARLRGSAPGTVKSQLNAIYRKAGVVGRSGLLALLIEDLMQEPLIEDSAAAA